MTPRPFFLFLLCSFALLQVAPAQRPGRPRRVPLSEQEKKTIAEGFKGLTTDGKVVPGLFKIVSTGVSTEPVKKAAEAFLNGLTAEQRKKTVFKVDDHEWRKWANQHSYTRQGVSFAEMNDEQRRLGFALLESGLSARGLQTTRDIMKLNETLAELKKSWDGYGEWLYHFTIMGEPSATKPWGWQFDGHHAIINYFVLGDQVVMSPVFLGSEPVKAESGKHKGTVIMQEEQDRGLAFMQSLPAAQQKQALIKGEKGGTNNLAEAFKDNLIVAKVGIRASEFDESAKKGLLGLIAVFVNHQAEGHAKVRLEEVKAHLEDTYFAWIGSTGKDAVFYYRIQSPVIYIEFDHQRPIGLQRTGIPSREHIHAVIRTPNGNDYGKSLLEQHYEKHHRK
ncbi:MAG: DUF3500 domain-containing protein [Roseibacillus sp.]|nr:DUF3500 domain-containing protein [Roseibacillus sp.]